MLGKAIEPAHLSLGYDWKDWHCMNTLIAARGIRRYDIYIVQCWGRYRYQFYTQAKNGLAVREDGTKVYTLATGLSLLIFYVPPCNAWYAGCCEETKSYKYGRSFNCCI